MQQESLPEGLRRMRGKYQVRWRDETRRRHARSFDHLEDATFFLAEQQQKVRRRQRGLEGLAPDTRTFDEVCRLWLDHVGAEKRSWKWTRSRRRWTR